MSLNNEITRFPGGVGTVAETDIFANLPFPDPSVYHTLLDDFDRFAADEWEAGGAGSPTPPALVAGNGGMLSMETSAAANDNNWLQQLQPAWEVFTQSGDQTFFRARAKVDDATNSVLVFGLQVAVASNNVLTPTDGVFLRKPAGSKNFVLVHRAAGVETVSDPFGPIDDNAEFDVAFYYDGSGVFAAGALNGTVRASLNPPTITTQTLALTVAVQAGTAAARTLMLDQVFVMKHRKVEHG